MSGPGPGPTPPPPPPDPVEYHKAGPGGNYGGGGGAASYYAANGAQGVIVLEYEPLSGGGPVSAVFLNFGCD